MKLNSGSGLGCAGFASKLFSLQRETKRNEIRFACFACVSLLEAKKYRYFSASFQYRVQIFCLKGMWPKKAYFPTLFRSYKLYFGSDILSEKKLGFCFLISRFASKQKKKIFPSFFPVSLLNEKITFSLPLSFSFHMFWLVLLQFRLGVQFFICMWTKRKFLFFLS